jgi:ABC-2 type transport system ATP-binding protein
MKQKLALACTLVHEPKLILLDEPTTGVDPVSRREFWKLLAEFLASGITILLTTPYLDEAERCSRVALLHEGEALAVDEPGALRASLPGELLEVIASDHRHLADLLPRLPGVTSVAMFGERAHVLFERSEPRNVERVAAQLQSAGLAVIGIRPIATSLEDVFIARLGAARR